MRVSTLGCFLLLGCGLTAAGPVRSADNLQTTYRQVNQGGWHASPGIRENNSNPMVTPASWRPPMADIQDRQVEYVACSTYRISACEKAYFKEVGKCPKVSQGGKLCQTHAIGNRDTCIKKCGGWPS